MSSTASKYECAPQHSATETTAAQATATAPNANVAKEIRKNAETEQKAAGQAATLAQGLGATHTGVDDVSTDQTVAMHEAQISAERTALDAVEQGKHDVDQAKNAASGYVDTAKSYVNTAIETAQQYLPTSMGGKPVDPASTTSRSLNSQPPSAGQQGIVDTVRNTASAAYTSAVETVQPAVDRVVNSAEEVLGTAGLQGKNIADRTHDPKPATESTGLGAKDAALTAPLQSGDKVVKGPYAEGVSSHEIGTNVPGARN